MNRRRVLWLSWFCEVAHKLCHSWRRNRRYSFYTHCTWMWSLTSIKNPVSCFGDPISIEIYLVYSKARKILVTATIVRPNSWRHAVPVYDGHFLFSGGGLNSNGGRGSKSFKRLAVRPVGWLCPICITRK